MMDGTALKPLSVSVKVGADLVGISLSSMWKYIKEGRVRTISLGRKRLIIYESLEELVAGKDRTQENL